MPTTPLVDFAKINLEETAFDQEEILRCVPHRFEMLQIDRIVCFDAEANAVVGIKEVRDDEFWVRGHIPGRPILPGILLLEASAQLAFFHFRKTQESTQDRFFGLAKIEEMRFRGIAVPGDQVVLVVKQKRFRGLAATYEAQAFVQGNMIFEAEIMGTTI